MIKYILLFFSFIPVLSLSAQDPQFSQLYAIPTYLGPSFAGASGGTRVILNARDQWPSIPNEYISYSLSADHYFAESNTGVGVALYRDHSGDGNLLSTRATLQYAYAFSANKDFNLRPGVQVSYVNRSIDYSKIVFGDQLTFDKPKAETIEPQLDESINYLDFSASVLGSHDRFWIGATLDHLTRPNQSLLGSKSAVPLKTVFYGGVKFEIKYRSLRSRREDLYVTFHYKHQENANQAYTGFYWIHNNILTGLWYRGMPFMKSHEDYLNNDAAVFMVGMRHLDFTFSYSYDFTLSQLITNAGGAHEISITWTKFPKKKKKLKVVSCPML